ncbi:MAG: hypothetical protein OEZ59_06375 [Deltaproteobacteria bacterium]|nr:hypothetical protein [Deltaproteobacteria bacterium]
MKILRTSPLRSSPDRKPLNTILPLMATCLWALFMGPNAAQAAEPLVSHYNLKLGASYSTSFIQITRKTDQSEARLVSDSDYSPYVSISSPPLFLGSSGFSIGFSFSYTQFEASQQSFTGLPGPQNAGTQFKARVLTATPALSYYLGRNSDFHFLRISYGAGWGWADMGGRVQFGNSPGTEPPENIEDPSGGTAAVSASVEYRIGSVSLAYYAGGPKFETDRHTYILGDNSLVLSYVISF